MGRTRTSSSPPRRGRPRKEAQPIKLLKGYAKTRTPPCRSRSPVTKRARTETVPTIRLGSFITITVGDAVVHGKVLEINTRNIKYRRCVRSSEIPSYSQVTVSQRELLQTKYISSTPKSTVEPYQSNGVILCTRHYDEVFDVATPLDEVPELRVEVAPDAPLYQLALPNPMPPAMKIRRVAPVMKNIVQALQELGCPPPNAIASVSIPRFTAGNRRVAFSATSVRDLGACGRARSSDVVDADTEVEVISISSDTADDHSDGFFTPERRPRGMES
eukprot:NODE_1118_length_1004_cov_58.701254_g1073_i0.p1 GENE.NODE_1118_length_1004_cov_58.701254_g1073_i0~~NODE_1118_length_1004_cov_58.701254_g1073_i0.p1  ORF type:complete len:274 (+),score=23.43 NODE_1118_length_1004_cov_58.701254_g1073_i0:99-920(+)